MSQSALRIYGVRSLFFEALARAHILWNEDEYSVVQDARGLFLRGYGVETAVPSG